MTDDALKDDIKSPREAAEYFAWVAGNDDQIDALAAAFEFRDNYWCARIAAREAENRKLREALSVNVGKILVAMDEGNLSLAKHYLVVAMADTSAQGAGERPAEDRR